MRTDIVLFITLYPFLFQLVSLTSTPAFSVHENDIRNENFRIDSLERLLERSREQLRRSHASLFAYKPTDERYFDLTDQDESEAKIERPVLNDVSDTYNEHTDGPAPVYIDAGDGILHSLAKDKRLEENLRHSQNPVAEPLVQKPGGVNGPGWSDITFVVTVAGCSAAAVFGIVAAGICWYKIQKNAKAAAETEYPAYGITGPSKDISPTGVSGDRKLAQSAQMYHYQHQKQQMIAGETRTTNDRHGSSDVESEEEGDEGDYTVYECPGLAPTGEMEVKNPLFQDDPTPASPRIDLK